MSDSTPTLERARTLFEIARTCFHYAPRGTPDGIMFERSETGRLLMRAMHKIAALDASGNDELEWMRAVLKDPAAVHVNMLRGGIARPSVRNIWHLYGEKVLLAEAPEHVRAALDASGNDELAIRLAKMAQDICGSPLEEAGPVAALLDEAARALGFDGNFAIARIQEQS